ncbi:hypothetical protein PMIN04_002648 [Paraphaeosphaeria minitans]|uniref:Uncharacterized protein n=1 Tax=Paraphaeosphaeria minitans TaxID=565426 RepID=A0A9P6GU51_9PLEO|nr:hypothetical protein PMIN01_01153 [Paraphaeosphaeria minitans]
MLRNLINDCRRMSASLPPDGWDDATPPPAIQRRKSGTLALSAVRRPSTRRVASAPATAPSQDKNHEAQPYQSKELTPSPATTSTSLAVQPPIPEPASVPSSPREAMQDSPCPAPSLPRTVPSPTPDWTGDAMTPARPIPRVALCSSRQQLLSPTPRSLPHPNGMHRPSPLRSVSMPGEGDSEIVLSPRDYLTRCMSCLDR